MKINCGPTWEQRDKSRREWHDSFALLPVRLMNGSCRCLEVVQRRLTKRYCLQDGGEFECWEYREKPAS